MTKTAYITVAVLSILIALTTLRALPLGLGQAFFDMADHIQQRKIFFLMHIIAASIALLCGVPQFAKNIRQQYPQIHRWTGRVYVIAVMVGALGGMSLALNAIAGTIAIWGFTLLSLLWVITTGMAIWHVRAGRISLHRDWMIRSFALTFAAVTLRLQLGGLVFGTGMDYEQASLILAWSCWVPNLIFAEWWIAQKRPGKLLVSPGA